jgi:predicted dehydrogenase
MSLRAAVIGLGVGEQHIAGYEAHPDCDMVAVCDIDAEKLEGRPEPRRTTNAAELLTDPDIDVVSIASYDDAHYEQVVMALRSGKHVFCEKPLCLYEEEAVEIARLARERPEQRLSSNLPLRLSPRFVELRERLARGELGELFHMEGDYDYGRRHKLTDGWRGDIPYYSVVLGGAIHLVDLLMWLSGKRPAAVLCAEGTRIATAGSKFRHPDFVTATLRMDDGSTMKVNANLGCVSPHFHAVRVYGTDGTFVNRLPDAELHTDGRTERIDAAYPGVAKGDLLHSFIESVLGRGEAQVTEDDVFATLSVCLAIERALRDGAACEVKYL